MSAAPPRAADAERASPPRPARPGDGGVHAAAREQSHRVARAWRGEDGARRSPARPSPPITQTPTRPPRPIHALWQTDQAGRHARPSCMPSSPRGSGRGGGRGGGQGAKRKSRGLKPRSCKHGAGCVPGQVGGGMRQAGMWRRQAVGWGGGGCGRSANAGGGRRPATGRQAAAWPLQRCQRQSRLVR